MTGKIKREKLDEIDKELIAKLDKSYSSALNKSRASTAEPDPSDAADLQPATSRRVPHPRSNRSTLKITDAQKNELQALQKDFSPKITEVLNAAQKTLIADFKKGQLAGAAGRGAPRKPGNTLFRATRYALTHPAFAGRSLTPGKTLVEIEEEYDQEKAKAAAAAKVKTAAASQ